MNHEIQILNLNFVQTILKKKYLRAIIKLDQNFGSKITQNYAIGIN